MNAISVSILFFAAFEVSCTHLCLEETNEVREKHNLHPYKIHNLLTKAAESHNDMMIETNCYSHRCPGEPVFGKRVDRAGYVYGRVAENLAAGYGNCKEAVNGWLNSPKHRKIILGNYLHMGCTFRKCSSCTYPTYWTCVYGSHFWY